MGVSLNELIKLHESSGKTLVLARDIHTFVESRQEFANWIKNRIEKYGFIEGVDFLINLSKTTVGRPTTEYYCTIGMAKELAMVENNDLGQQARRYFIECERKLKEVYQIPQTFSQALLLAAKQAEQIEMQQKVIKDKEEVIEKQTPKVAFYDQIIEVKDEITMQKVAGVLNIKGLGRNKLFDFLRHLQVLNRKNIPYRNFIDAGYFRTVENMVPLKEGRSKIVIVSLVTQKGLAYIRKLVERDLEAFLNLEKFSV